MKRKSKRRWSLAVLAALVAFAQFAIAAQPCMLVHEPAAPLEQNVAEDRCDAVPMDQANCLTQCLAEDGTASALSPLLGVALPSSAAASPDFTLAATHLPVFRRAEAPPVSRALQILYCSYQT